MCGRNLCPRIQRTTADLEKRWIEGFAYTRELFKKPVEVVHALLIGSYRAADFAPLVSFDRFVVEPVTIILVVNSLRTYIALVGCIDTAEDKPVCNFDSQAACENIVAVMRSKSP